MGIDSGRYGRKIGKKNPDLASNILAIPDVKRRAAALVHTTAGAGKFISLPVVEDEPDPAAPAAFEETEPQESQEDGVEYDERQIERLNAQLKGVEFVDDRVRWRVLKVSFDAEREAPVCFYFDAGLGDEGTLRRN